MSGKSYRLKINHCNYKKGNVVSWDEEGGNYSNHYLSVFRRRRFWAFQQWYIDKHPEIFEEVKYK